MNPSDQSNTKASPTEMEPTAPSPQNAEVAEGQMAKATATAGRPTPSPNQDIPQAAPSLSAPSTELDSSCTATGTANGSSVLKVKEEPIDETMMNPEADKRHTQMVMASNFSTFLTPSPLADGAKNNGTKPKKELIAVKTEQQECERFSPPKGQMSFPGSESAMPSSAEFTLSNFSFSNGDGSCGLLSDPFVDTPDPASTSSSIDFNSFGREFNGSSAPTLSYRPPFDLDTSGEFSSFHGANNASGPVDMSQYSMVDQFALPPYLQAHLDETYAASTLIFPNNPQDHDARSGNVVFQVTAYRPRSSAPGTTPPAICRSSERESRANYNDENKENVNPAAVAVNRPNQNCKAAATAAAAAAAASSKSKSTRNKPRPLPLRKRPLNQDSPVQKKRATRMQDPAPSENNVEEEEEKDRLVCRCAKSKCLKLYCDCFQRGKICIGRCSCTNCKNTEANSGPNGIRTKTIREILERRPDAFERRGKRTGEGCSCKKNKCLKKYCDCFNIGNKCDPMRCRCTNCANYEGAGDDLDDEGVRARRPASFFEVPKKVEPRLPAHYVQVPVQRGRDESNSASDDDSSYEDEAEAEEVMSNKRIDATYKLRDGAAFEPSHNTIDTGLAVGFGTPSPAKLTQYECI